MQKKGWTQNCISQDNLSSVPNRPTLFTEGASNKLMLFALFEHLLLAFFDTFAALASIHGTLANVHPAFCMIGGGTFTAVDDFFVGLNGLAANRTNDRV